MIGVVEPIIRANFETFETNEEELHEVVEQNANIYICDL